MKKGILLTVVLFQMTIVQAYSPFNKNGDNNMSQKTFFDNKEISNYDIGGDAKINALYNEVKGNSSYTNFEIDVPTTNSYFLNFWLCPARLSSNEYAVYNVLIDGLKIGCITPRKGDWQSISIDDNTSVVIQKGSHVLSITGVIPDIPSVEFVKLSAQRATSTISVNAYQKYKKDLVERSSNMSEKNGMALTAYSDSLSGIPKESPARSYWFPQDDPPYDSPFSLNKTTYYTFYKTFYFQQGQTINVSTTKIDNFSHVIEVFSSQSPQSYTWKRKTLSDNTTSLSINIPYSDYYIIRIRSLINETSGLCNLNINNTYYYDDIPLYSYGYAMYVDANTTYNCFTCHNTGDPRMWIEKRALIPGSIYAYNDDYYSSGYNWGTNSRIKQQHPMNTIAVHTTSYSSYTPSCTCDIYYKCLSAFVNDGDDYIQSSSPSNDYNCHSWAGGIYSFRVVPFDYFYMYVNDELSAFDYYFALDRYPGCSIYTRDGATAENSCIDLWAKIVNGSMEYTHTSIRKGSDSNAHGYDWESKCGNSVRIYHPRNSFPFTSYGQVVGHYRRVDSLSGNLSLEESISAGLAVVKNVQFTNDEMEFIDSKLLSFSINELDSFNRLYNKWDSVWSTSIHSNPDLIADCDEYRQLQSYCNVNSNWKYAVFKKMGSGSLSSMRLVRDLTVQDHKNLIKQIFEKNKLETHTSTGAKIVYTPESNAMAYIKEIIKAQVDSLQLSRWDKSATGVRYSNTDEFEASTLGNIIMLKFQLDDNKRITLDVIDLKGNPIATIIANKNLCSNTYSYQCLVPSGIYLIRYIVNGNLNVRKVYVK